MLVTGNTGTMSRKSYLTLMAAGSTSSASGRKIKSKWNRRRIGGQENRFWPRRDRRSRWVAESEYTLQSGCAKPGLLETPENSKGLFDTTANTAARYGDSQRLLPKTMARRRTPIFH